MASTFSLRAWNVSGPPCASYVVHAASASLAEPPSTTSGAPPLGRRTAGSSDPHGLRADPVGDGGGSSPSSSVRPCSSKAAAASSALYVSDPPHALASRATSTKVAASFTGPDYPL